MYLNLQTNGLGGFNNGPYWSSSQGVANYAADIISFGIGEIDTNNHKSFLRVIRAIRTF